MKGFNNIKGNRVFLCFSILLILLLVVQLFVCCRRDLWVYQDRFKQILIDIDWRNYFRDAQLYSKKPDPDGMTVWFFPKDGRTSYSYTTSEVRHYETYLSKGDYEGLVIDYSPAEYSHQEFVGMDFAQTAKVQTKARSYQVDSFDDLYGFNCFAHMLPSIESSGLYTISWEPEDIASDTIHMRINTGEYDEYIPYEKRDSYQSTLVPQVFKMEPLIIPWRMRVRVYVKGIYYLYQTKGSIAGLADGYYFMQDRTSDIPCLLALDDWEAVVTGDNVGYVVMTFKTWGPRDFSLSSLHARNNNQPITLLDSRPTDDVRLNLRFLLRDRQTVCNYHWDVGNLIRIFENEYALRIDLMEDYDGIPDLPYVEPYNGMGFDGIVVPWDEGGDVDVKF